MQTLWVGIGPEEVLCHDDAANDVVQQLREGRHVRAGGGLWLEAVRDTTGTVIGFGIIIKQNQSGFLPINTDEMSPFKNSAKRVLLLRGIIGREQSITIHVGECAAQMAPR